MSTPATITDHDAVLACPIIGMNKHPERVESARQFLKQISAWLEPFGVRTQSIIHEPGMSPVDKEPSDRLRLVLSGEIESLINLWSRVGYEYHAGEPGWPPCRAVPQAQAESRRTRSRSPNCSRTRRPGTSRRQIVEQRRQRRQNFIDRAGRRPGLHPASRQGLFNVHRFCAEAKVGKPGGMVWERIARSSRWSTTASSTTSLSNTPTTTSSPAVVVSNCGVRLISSISS
jgi:hypothetical protein